MVLCDLLRASLLFIIDELFENSFGVTEFTNEMFPTNSTSMNSSLDLNVSSESAQYYKAICLSLTKIIVSSLIFCLSLCIIVLPSRYLYLIYFHLVSVCVVLFSYWENNQSLNVLFEKHENLEIDLMFEVMTLDFNRIVNLLTKLQVVDFVYILFQNTILQCFLSLVFYFIQVLTANDPVHKVFSLSFIIPTLVALVPGTHAILKIIVVLATLLPLFVKLKTLWLNVFTIKSLIHDGYNHMRETINNNGLNTWVQMEWNRLNIPNVLLIFWVIRQILYLLTDTEIKYETMYGVVKYLLIKGCDTYIAIFGMTSFVSYLCHYIGQFFQWVLLSNNVDGNIIRVMSAVFFSVLALQTELTYLEPEKRFTQLYKNVCLLCAALSFYIHNGVDQLLISLSVSFNPSLNKHLRALLVCGFLIVFPITILKYLWTYHSISSWFLVVSTFYIDVVIRVLLSLAKYSLFLVDAYRLTFWERLDDYVYCIILFGSMVKYCCGLIVFLDAVYVIIFVSGSVVRVIVTCIHAYFKLWCVARNGWRQFIKRYTVVRKIESLPEATSNQLANLDDVCSICHQNMVSAKITHCNHYFHGVCLRKWLHLEDRCPLCHAKF